MIKAIKANKNTDIAKFNGDNAKYKAKKAK
jgi:hypothetical protein